jgi:diadenylate cyclase
MMKNALAAFGWRDAVDVTVVAFLVYRVLVMFRGTRAVQMAAGLGALVAASLFASWLELQSLQWIVGYVWSFWVIGLVVLFQPELRRALTRIGQGRWVPSVLGGSAGEESAHVVDELVATAESLAARRIGALVVLERSTGLRQYAELGVALDALVSSDLLGSLFLPYSPLHDGAVLIQGSRVVAAGCFLPLSRNLRVGRALGTRHRAALGITEDTDAVAMVVSEETGRIALAIEGELETPADPGSLRRRLGELLGTVSTREPATALWRGMRRLLPGATDHA